jgi:hypothetical protein
VIAQSALSASNRAPPLHRGAGIQAHEALRTTRLISSLKGAVAAGPVRRYARQHSGELNHLDIKKSPAIDGAGRRIAGDSGRLR